MYKSTWFILTGKLKNQVGKNSKLRLEESAEVCRENLGRSDNINNYISMDAKSRYQSPSPKNSSLTKQPNTTMKQMMARNKPRRPGPFAYNNPTGREDNPEFYLSPSGQKN